MTERDREEDYESCRHFAETMGALPYLMLWAMPPKLTEACSHSAMARTPTDTSISAHNRRVAHTFSTQLFYTFPHVPTEAPAGLYTHTHSHSHTFVTANQAAHH